MAKLKFVLVSPEKELFSRDVDQVDVPGGDGYLGIMPGHAPLMSTVETGFVKIYNDGQTEEIHVEGGFADITPAGLTILAEKATPKAEMQ